MKKLITLLIVIVAIVAIGTLVYSALQHREQYVSNQKAEVESERASDAEQQAKIEALESQVTEISQESERRLAECMKGQEAYNALTAFNKTRFEAPACEPVTE